MHTWASMLVSILSLMLVSGTPAPSSASGTDGRPRASSTAAAPVVGPGCGDVLIIGVRGSGQTASDRGGWGREAAGIRDAVIARSTGLLVDTQALDYPAAPTSLLAPTRSQVAEMASGQPGLVAHGVYRWARNRLGEYLESISTGVGSLRRTVTAALGRCPSRKLILAGYSQGSMVVHRWLVATAKGAARGQLRSVASVALLADGDRVAGSTQNRAGSATVGAKGISVFGGAYKADVPDSVASRTWSYCTDNDLVCDATPGNLVHFERGSKIHTTYRADQLTRLGRLVATRLPHPPRYGTETGRTVIQHPTWGRVTVVTSFREYDGRLPGEGFIRVVDGAGRLRWRHRTGLGQTWYRMELNSPSVDDLGHLFFNWDPGRYNGVTVLRPVAGGFADFDTLPDVDDYDSRFYYAEVVDADGDGILEVEAFNNDCDPSCAGGTITSTVYGWDGRDYVPQP